MGGETLAAFGLFVTLLQGIEFACAVYVRLFAPAYFCVFFHCSSQYGLKQSTAFLTPLVVVAVKHLLNPLHNNFAIVGAFSVFIKDLSYDL